MGDKFSYQSAVEKVRKLRAEDSSIRIGLTTGTFDLIHAGHVRALNEFKEHCDFLIVCVTSDEKVAKKKGVYRPIKHEDERLEIIEAMQDSDYVVLAEPHDSKRKKLIDLIKPDVFFKGKEPPELKDESIHYIPEKPSNSTSGIIDKILTDNAEEKSYGVGEKWRDGFDWHKEDDPNKWER